MITAELMAWADWIIPMTLAHEYRRGLLYPQYSSKLRSLEPGVSRGVILRSLGRLPGILPPKCPDNFGTAVVSKGKAGLAESGI